MKDLYLSPESIDQVAREIAQELTGRNYRPKPWNLKPDKAALLVLDMQNYFLDPASHAFTPSAPAIVPNINRLIDFANENGMEIIFTKHVNNAENAGMMGKWWRDMIGGESWGAEIIELGSGEAENSGTENLEPGTWNSFSLESCKLIVKNQYDAFYGTDLEELLRSKGIGQVIITGVLTNLCCETTARSAFVRGFEVLFPVDATAAYNREFHLSTFRNLGFGFCPILTTDDLINSNES